MATMTGWTQKAMGKRARYVRMSGGFEVVKDDFGRWIAYHNGAPIGTRRARNVAMSLCEQVAETERRTAARRTEPTIAIEVYPTRYGTTGVKVIFDWTDGREVHPNTLRAQVARTLADIFEAAACMTSAPQIGQPEVDELNLMGGNRLRTVLRFETGDGTPAEAEALSTIIHDAIPAPGEEG